MPDYHHDLLFGISVPPNARDHRALLAIAELADDAGLDIIGFQDHPYQARFLDAWTLLSYVAGRTQHIRVFPNVANIPLGPPAVWAEQLTDLALTDGISAFNLGVSPNAETDVRTWAEEVAPAVREAVAKQRQDRLAPSTHTPAVDGDRASETAARAAREAQSLVAEDEQRLTVGRAGQQTLLAIHQHLRQELSNLRDVIQEVRGGRTTATEARSYLNTMTMRQNYWTLGAFCAAYCRVVSVHHAIEDQSLFPDLKAADQSLGPIIERLQHEHEGIAKVLGEIDVALVAMVDDDERLDETQNAVDYLSDALLAHLKYEEDQLLEPIGRLAIRI